MKRVLIKVITYLVIISFSLQNLVRAEGDSMLARDSKDDIEALRELLGNCPGQKGPLWERFKRGTALVRGRAGAVPKGKSVEELEAVAEAYSDAVRIVGDGPYHRILKLLSIRGAALREIDKKTGTTKFPAGLNKEMIEIFWREIGNFGVIEGIIGADRKLVFDLKNQSNFRQAEIKNMKKFKDILKRLNILLQKIEGLPSDTTVRLTSEGTAPLLYHKDKKVLEMHALLLAEQIYDPISEFALRHDERHCLIEGLPAWWEELLNIYMDILKLESMEEKADKTIACLRRMEGEGGYWRLLVKRREIFSDGEKQKNFLKDLLGYIIQYHPELVPSGIKTPEEFFDLLKKEMDGSAISVMTLWYLAKVDYPDTFKGLEEIPSPMQYLFLLAKVCMEQDGLKLFGKWKNMEKEVLKKINESGRPVDIESLGIDIKYTEMIVLALWMEGRIEQVFSEYRKPQYFSKAKTQEMLKEGKLIEGYIWGQGRHVYFPADKKGGLWLLFYLQCNLFKKILDRYKESRKETNVLKQIFDIMTPVLSNEDLDYNLQVAKGLSELGADFSAVCAALLKGIDIDKIELEDMSGYELKILKHTENQADKIVKLPYFPKKGSSYSVQNYINLFIQLCTNSQGMPDYNVMLMAILTKLQDLKRLADNPLLYQDLSEEEKEYLGQKIRFIYAPLAEFLGMEDIAIEFREKWFLLSEPERYAGRKEEVERFFGMRYEDLAGLLELSKNRIRDGLEEKGIKDVRFRCRVKSIYSIDEKIRKKTDEYPDVRSFNDILGIQLIFPTSEFYEQNHRDIHKVLHGIYGDYMKYEHKPREQYGYEKEDFIGISEGGLLTEVHIYPSERDFGTYHTGGMAHWIYKLRRECKGQVFDVALLDRIQGKLKGEPKEDFKTIYDALSQWVFAGIIVRDAKDKNREKIRIVKLPSGATGADLASVRGVNLLDRNFPRMEKVDVELRDDRLEFKITKAGGNKVIPGIYIARQGDRMSDEQIRKMRRETVLIRAYLLLSGILDTNLRVLGQNKGRELFTGALETLGYKREFLTKQKKVNLIDPVSEILGLSSAGDYGEFYELVYLLACPGDNILFQRVYRQIMYGMIKERAGDITDDEIREKLKEAGFRKITGRDMMLIYFAYLVTARLRGKEILRENIDKREENVEKKLELLLPEYMLENLEQLYAKLGMYPDFIYNLLIKYSSGSMPVITYKVKEDRSGIYNRVFKIIEREDVQMEDPYADEEDRNTIYIPIYPPKVFVVSAIGRILDAIKDIPGIEPDSVRYIKKAPDKLADKRIEITVPQNENRVLGVMAEFMPELDISIGIEKDEKAERGSKKKIIIAKDMPEQVPDKIITEAVMQRLKKKGIKFLLVAVKNIKKGMNGFFILGGINLKEEISSIPDVSFDPMILCYIGIFVAACIIVRIVLKRAYLKKLNRKIDKLFNKLQDFDSEEPKDTELLVPFYATDIPAYSSTDVDLKDILCQMTILRVNKVKTGYKISGTCKGRVYRFLVVGEDYQDIGYNPEEKDSEKYFSLGAEITGECRHELFEKIQLYESEGRQVDPIRRKIAVPMKDRAELERFSRESIFCRSVLERFQNAESRCPSFTHNRYMLVLDEPHTVAWYMPRGEFGSGFVVKDMRKDVKGTEAMHEIAHAIYDYNGELQDKLAEHFGGNPNTKLKDAVAESYEFDLSDENGKRRFVDEQFAYTLAGFAAMRRPWYEIEEINGIRKKFDKMSIEDIRETLIERILNVAKDFGREIKVLERLLTETSGIWAELELERISETKARQEYFEIIKKLINLVELPPVRLIDVRFFAENGIIEPWMNPLELGYREKELNSDVDTEYYLRLIEFLVLRSKIGGAYYKLYSNGRWIKTPYGEEALTEARRLAWTLIKTSYGIDSIDDITRSDYSIRQFRTAPVVLSIIKRLADSEMGVEKKIHAGRNRRGEILKWFKRKIKGIRSQEGKDILRFCEFNPWLSQAFFEEAVFNTPKILLLDIKTLEGLGEKNMPRVVRLINQVNGRVVIFCSDIKMRKVDARQIVFNFWESSSGLLNKKAKKRLTNILAGICFIDEFDNERSFVRRIYEDIRKRYKIQPENIMIFTNADEFIKAWRDIARGCLFYLLIEDNLYITSEDLLAMQIIIGEKKFDLGQGETIELLPEYYYTDNAARDLQQMQAEQGA